ncbi:MAG: S8 family serine peptidase [Planctomycetes bacterium]|nr:S8 family serine peptidase [Planctomycetota bacterium]
MKSRGIDRRWRQGETRRSTVLFGLTLAVAAGGGTMCLFAAAVTSRADEDAAPRSHSALPVATVGNRAAVGAPDSGDLPRPRAVRIPASSRAAVTALNLEARVHIDYGPFDWMVLEPSEYARLSSAGIAFELRPNAFVLRLGELSFDPIAEPPSLPKGWDEVGEDGPDLHLVQFVGPTRAQWLEGLRAAGLRVVQYVHPFTYIVWGEPADRAQAAALASVRWTGPFAPAYRVLPRWRGLPPDLRDVNILVYRGADVDGALASIEALGATVTGRDVLNDIFEVAAVTMPGTALRAAASVPGVYSIQPIPTDGGLRTEMSDQINVNNHDESNLAFPGYLEWLDAVGVDGTGVIIANVDGGIQDSHPDLINRLIPCVGVTCGGGASSSHGTHTAGIMAADGSSGVTDGFGFLRGLGQAPGANLVEQTFRGWYQQPGGMLLLMTDSFNNGASLSGNSWGPSGSPQGYDYHTMQVDIGVRDADPDAPGNQPLTFVLSFMNGNGGTSTQGTPDEAKNLFNIGSTKMQNSNGSQILQIDDLSSNTAHGPALDGRTIPHMVAPGCRVDSSTSGSGYTLMCGTSMASPHVSGAVAVFIDYYRSLEGVTEDPSPALIKAAFLPVAHDLAGFQDADGGTLGHPFDSKQGWGRMDLDAVVNPAHTVRYFDSPVTFDNTGEEWVMTVSPIDPNEPLKFMLVWTDAYGHGLGGSQPAWNNDLDLVVESGGQTYRGNDFMADGWSRPNGVADFKNNTEGVFLGPIAPASVTLRVVAADINSDGVPNNGDDTDQDFAIVCVNCAEEPGFAIAISPSTLSICTPEEPQYEIEVAQIMGFTEPVTLSAIGQPASATVGFSENPVVPPGTSTMTIFDTGAAAPGLYEIEVAGVSASMTRTTTAALWVYDEVPSVPILIIPPDGWEGVSLLPQFGWSIPTQVDVYTWELATDVDFANIVETASGLTVNAHEAVTVLDPLTQYYWHVKADNPCGEGAYSMTWSFETRDVPTILMVDDDDNSPDVRPTYTDALETLGLDFDLWDTANSDNEPDVATLSQYSVVIWFTGDEWGGFCGPGPASEVALAAYLDSGGGLFLTSQDYHYDRGMTAFMQDYLGAGDIVDDVGQTSVSGAGAIFGDLGSFPMSYPGANYSDRVTPDATADVAFVGNQGNAAVSKDNGVFRTVFLGFPWEAISSADDREAVLSAAIDWSAGDVVIDCNGNGTPDELEALGDFDFDCDVDLDDYAEFLGCWQGPDNMPSGELCGVGDHDFDGDVDLLDFRHFLGLFGG